MSNPTARSSSVPCQPKPRGSSATRGFGTPVLTAGGMICFLLALGAVACTSGSSSPAASGGQSGSSSAQNGGSSGTGGAAQTGGSSSVGGQAGSTAISSGTGGAAGGGTGGVNRSGGVGAGGVTGSGGAGSGGVTGSGGAAPTGGAQAGAGGNGTASGGAGGRGGSSGSGGATKTGGTTSSGGTTSQGGAGGTTSKGGSGGGGSATDAGAAGQSGGDAGTLASDSLAVRFANMILSKWPDPASIDATAGFEYNHGIVLRGVEQVYRHTGDSRYLAYIQKYIDENVSAAGVINLGTAFVAFDDMQPSVLLPFLYQQTGLAKYQTAADTVRAFYDKIPTNGDGGYWHKQALPNQMWLDGIYMGEPFLARYGAVFGTCGTFCGSTVVKQATLVGQHTLDTATGLYYHAWWDNNPTGTTKPNWADANGRSPCIWGRAMGWYAMALVDTLGDLPADQTGRSDLLANLTGLAAGLKTTQDAKTGLWYQVMDQGSKSDNWTETSASGMFVYALKVAVNRGYIDSSYLSVANSGWTGLQTKVTTDASGSPSITGAVQGMNAEPTYALYVSQATKTNSSHGLCAILLAAAEMEAR